MDKFVICVLYTEEGIFLDVPDKFKNQIDGCFCGDNLFEPLPKEPGLYECDAEYWFKGFEGMEDNWGWNVVGYKALYSLPQAIESRPNHPASAAAAKRGQGVPMNKLTEIKEKLNKYKGMKVAAQKRETDGLDPFQTSLTYMPKMNIIARELAELMLETNIFYLLEEKDKALTIYADEENWGDDRYGCSKIFHGADDGYEIARKALNTSSKEESQ